MRELKKIFEFIDAHFDGYIEETRRFLRQPSVSIGDREKCLPDIKKSGEMLVKYIEDLGGEARLVPIKEGFPIVYGKKESKNPEAKTLILYALYDVMPVDPEKWRVPPFSAEILDAEEIGVPPLFGKVIVCRGASNQKGPLMAFVNGVRSMVEVTGDVPVNLVFLIEGEEEIGSIHLPEFVDEYSGELKKADGVMFPRMPQKKELNRVHICLGAKGYLPLELVVKGNPVYPSLPGYPLYAADDHLIDSPAWRLTHAISTLRSLEGKVLVEGFYDNVIPTTQEEKKWLLKIVETFDEEEKKGLSEKLLERYVMEPNLNIESCEFGYAGPFIARACGSIWLAPNQTPDEISRKLRSHLDKRGFGEVEIHTQGGYSAYRTPITADIAQAAIRVTKKFGVEPLVTYGFYNDPMGVITKLSNIPAVELGLGGSGNAHQINEWVSVEGLRNAEKYFCAFLEEYSKTKKC